MLFSKDVHRFSFLLDGRDIWSLPHTVTSAEEGDTQTLTYSFGDLRVETRLTRHGEACEWVNYLENMGSEPSGLISELWDCDLSLPLPHEEPAKWQAYLADSAHATRVDAPRGSVWTALEFYCDTEEFTDNRRLYHLRPGETQTYATSGGRSSEAHAPFFDISKDGVGYILAVGWTGQWHFRATRSEDDVRLQSGIEDTCFRLLPREGIRTSSVLILPYTTGREQAHNAWRRLLRQDFSLLGRPGRDARAPLCAGIWGGMTSAEMLERVETIKKNRLPFEYVWIDAGWYGETTAPTPDEFEGDWGLHTGDWRPSPLCHPNGLRDVSEAVHAAGMKLLLWLEPERVVPGTPITQEHPEYFLKETAPGEAGWSWLLDLGNEAAWQYCFDTLSELIERLHIDFYRQDFNMAPLPYWRTQDVPDRRGMTEIKHICGLYRLWDSLLARFPWLMIDNCASGGRRIDIETLRRSVPLWRSDYQCPANYEVGGAQCHAQTFGAWMPHSGTGTGREYDEYRFRSAYAPGLTTNYSFSAREGFCDTEEKVAFLRKYTEEYLRVRPYLTEDIYPLTHPSTAPDVWCATQYDRPEKGDGLLTVIRRENAPYETATFALRGIRAEATYRITDADGGSFTLLGRDLLADGLTLALPEKRKAKIYFYEAISS